MRIEVRARALKAQGVSNARLKAVICHDHAEFAEYTCRLLGGYGMDMRTYVACDNASAIADDTVLLKGFDQQAQHRYGVMRTYAEIARLLTAGRIKDRTIDRQGFFVKEAPFPSGQPAAVQPVKELFAVFSRT